jgi:signal transduction histidine kinase
MIGRTWIPTVGAPDVSGTEPVADQGDGPPELRGVDLVVPIRHGHEVLGAIAVTKSGPGSLIPLEHRLVTDLASQAGIVTHTLHLRENLRHRLKVSRHQQRTLVASRVRVIAAQDEERRRLERDIHDTCQQQAVVLAGRLGLAGALARRDPRQAQAVLDEACLDVVRLASALDRLTSAAPIPELVADGIGSALRTATAALPIAIDIEDALVRRYHPGVEATVYFCGMEAIQNATKHAEATTIRLNLSEASGWLSIEVCDDGVGFDVGHSDTGTGLHNIRERLRPWQGRLVITSSSTGTQVAVEIPVAAHEATP